MDVVGKMGSWLVMHGSSKGENKVNKNGFEWQLLRPILNWFVLRAPNW